MIDYQKSCEKLYNAWMAYIANVNSVLTGQTISCTDFAAGYNACLHDKLKDVAYEVFHNCPDAEFMDTDMTKSEFVEIWGTYNGNWRRIGVGNTELQAWENANNFLMGRKL